MLAPLAPFRGEGPGVRGLRAASFVRRIAGYTARLAPLIPRPSPPQSRGRREPECRLLEAKGWRPRTPSRTVVRQTTPSPSLPNLFGERGARVQAFYLNDSNGFPLSATSTIGSRLHCFLKGLSEL